MKCNYRNAIALVSLTILLSSQSAPAQTRTHRPGYFSERGVSTGPPADIVAPGVTSQVLTQAEVVPHGACVVDREIVQPAVFSPFVLAQPSNIDVSIPDRYGLERPGLR